MAVSSSFLDKFEVDASPDKKLILYNVMGNIHNSVSNACATPLLRRLSLKGSQTNIVFMASKVDSCLKMVTISR